MAQDLRVETTKGLRSLRDVNVFWLEDLASWQGDDLVIRQDTPLPPHWGPNSIELHFMARWLRSINRMQTCTAEPEFSYSVADQRTRANVALRLITQESPSRHTSSPEEWASDGSMVCTNDTKSVTCAAVGTKSITAKILNPQANSLHGEIGALVLAADGIKNELGGTAGSIIHTDYLNAIGKLQKSLSFPMPGVHWYRWYRELSTAGGPFEAPPTLSHVKAHTAVVTTAEIMNDECDHNAKGAHTDEAVPILPEPIFLLPRYVLRNGRSGYIETDCRTIVMEASVDERSTHLPRNVGERMVIGNPRYDQAPINWYAANKSIYGWSLETQMLARGHVLDTGARRLKSFGPDPIHSRTCVFCDADEEDEDHIFLQCSKHDAWRQQSTDVLSDFIVALDTDDDTTSRLLFWAEALLINDPRLWPSEGKSKYFAGFLPTMDVIQQGFASTETGKKVLDLAYYELRKLTGRIFGARVSAVTRRARAEEKA